MTSLMIMFAVHPICVQDSIFKMYSESPGDITKMNKTFWGSTGSVVGAHTSFYGGGGLAPIISEIKGEFILFIEAS